MDVDELSPIQSYYCTCKSDARTLGSCAHVASVLSFLGFARHQDVRYPSILIRTIKNAGNRPQQENPN